MAQNITDYHDGLFIFAVGEGNDSSVDEQGNFNVQAPNHSSESESDKDKDNETAYVNIYDEEDMVEDDNEITAERTIPSYFLKVVFLNEMETFHKENKVFDEKQIPSMTRRVYDRLQRAFEENTLSSLFLPDHNVLQTCEYFPPGSSMLMFFDARKMFCSNILRVLDALGFQDN